MTPREAANYEQPEPHCEYCTDLAVGTYDGLDWCCRCMHRTARRDEDLWATLIWVGQQDDGDGGKMELRNCPFCATTLARTVAP
jgi:hypothetical protein